MAPSVNILYSVNHTQEYQDRSVGLHHVVPQTQAFPHSTVPLIRNHLENWTPQKH